MVAGFSCAGVWPFDLNAMKEKLARQPLTAKQLNQQPSSKQHKSCDYNLSVEH